MHIPASQRKILSMLLHNSIEILNLINLVSKCLMQLLQLVRMLYIIIIDALTAMYQQWLPGPSSPTNLIYVILDGTGYLETDHVRKEYEK